MIPDSCAVVRTLPQPLRDVPGTQGRWKAGLCWAVGWRAMWGTGEGAKKEMQAVLLTVSLSDSQTCVLFWYYFI